jgi:hypothetical protein
MVIAEPFQLCRTRRLARAGRAELLIDLIRARGRVPRRWLRHLRLELGIGVRRYMFGVAPLPGILSGMCSALLPVSRDIAASASRLGSDGCGVCRRCT